MLVTSSQVSVAISSFIVFLFTTALFLSGYVLQQQTVRDIRKAIKPKPRPTHNLIYLPKQFAEADGADTREKANDAQIVEVKMAGNENVVEEQTKKPAKIRHPSESTQKILDMAKLLPALEDATAPGGDDASERADFLPDNEVRQVEAVQQATTAETGSEKPLSRAERRKRIKEEIMEGSEEGMLGAYKRRQW
ncbi:hypothetical protein BP6252_11659 [Coleophoma cylindrospora]|uniref:Uncharacterized protein n=1 Tax=Coleophoma cylindrospora TaxID=1849047 RepID=A0A3D8QK73_9HELO|nr:hypothetical protein BP6252_11659 [Coleophoma cylindrospora]